MTILIMTIFMWLKINYPLQIAQALAGDSDSESPSLTCSSDFRLLAIMAGLYNDPTIKALLILVVSGIISPDRDYLGF